MRSSPSIVPPGTEQDVYLVFDDFGRLGTAWVEMEGGQTDRETVIRELLGCQFNDPIMVVTFNIEQGTSRDASAEIAHELIERTANDPDGLPRCLQDFVNRYGTGLQQPRQLSPPIKP